MKSGLKWTRSARSVLSINKKGLFRKTKQAILFSDIKKRSPVNAKGFATFDLKISCFSKPLAELAVLTMRGRNNSS